MADPRTVMVIDDDPAVLDSLRVMLQTHGFRVTCAAHANEAIERIADRAPDVILTDVFMPEGDGFELIAALRRRKITIPVVAMSGSSRGQLEIAAQLGAVATIEKPFRAEDLINTIVRVVGGSQEIVHGNDSDGG